MASREVRKSKACQVKAKKTNEQRNNTRRSTSGAHAKLLQLHAKLQLCMDVLSRKKVPASSGSIQSLLVVSPAKISTSRGDSCRRISRRIESYPGFEYILLKIDTKVGESTQDFIQSLGKNCEESANVLEWNNF
jgi:hypothetical protein